MVSSRWLLSLSILAAVLVPVTDLHAAPSENKQLAKEISKLLGARVKAKSIQRMDLARVDEWRGIPDFVREKMHEEYERFVMVKYRHRRTAIRSIVVEAPAELAEQHGIDFIYAVRQDVDKPIRTCTGYFCDIMNHGRCVQVVIGTTDENCPEQCLSDDDCGHIQECNTPMCSPDGACVYTHHHAPTCTDPQCTSDADCQGQQNDVSCPVKMCDGGECRSLVVEVTYPEPCPDDQCTSDDLCDAGELEDILVKLGT